MPEILLIRMGSGVINQVRMDDIQINRIGRIVKAILGILVLQRMRKDNGCRGIIQPVGRFVLFVAGSLVVIIQVIIVVVYFPDPGVILRIIIPNPFPDGAGYLAIIRTSGGNAPGNYHYIMTGQEGDGKGRHIVDVPDRLVQGEVPGLADGRVFVNGQRLVLPVQQIAGGFQDGLAFICLGTQDGNVYIETVPIVPFELVERQEDLIIVFTTVVGIAVLRFPSPVHLQFKVGRFRRKARLIINLRIARLVT